MVAAYCRRYVFFRLDDLEVEPGSHLLELLENSRWLNGERDVKLEDGGPGLNRFRNCLPWGALIRLQTCVSFYLTNFCCHDLVGSLGRLLGRHEIALF